MLTSAASVWKTTRPNSDLQQSLPGLRRLGPHAAVAKTNIRFEATDTLGSTTARNGVCLVPEESDGIWRIVANHRTMVVVPLNH